MNVIGSIDLGSGDSGADVQRLRQDLEEVRARLDRVDQSLASAGLRADPAILGQNLSTSLGVRSLLGGTRFLKTYQDPQAAVEIQNDPWEVFWSLISVGLRLDPGSNDPFNGLGLGIFVPSLYTGSDDTIRIRSTNFGPTAQYPRDLALEMGEPGDSEYFTGFLMQRGSGSFARQITIGDVFSSVKSVNFNGNALRIRGIVSGNYLTPVNSAAAGEEGMITFDEDYIYVRSGGSWRRAALALF